MGACGSTLMKPCLGETDIRYDTAYPKTIVESDSRWEKLSGYFLVNVTGFDAQNAQVIPMGPYIPGVAPTEVSPFPSDSIIAFYNHTVDGSRLIANRYYFRAPAPPEFCAIPFPPPAMNAPPGVTCGENGLAKFAGVYAALNHENDGTLSIASATGLYANNDEGVFQPDLESSSIKLADGNTFEFTFNVKDSFSSVSSFVFFDDQDATLSAVHTNTALKKIASANTASMVRLTEEEFLSGIEEYNSKFNIPENMRVQVPMTSDEVPSLAGTFPSEDEWCGGLINDVSCTASPYEEPAAQMKGGFIALFVVLGALVFGVAAYLLHRKVAEDQKRRYKEHFVRGIARNITIADSAGKVSPEELKKEFDHIDSDGGGTISKDELKTFVDSGKVGTISDKDFEALWHAIDIDNSGEVDFVEFLSFLGGCGTEFDSVNQEQKTMTKEQRMKYASQRLSTRALQIPKDDEGDEESGGAADAAKA